MSARPDPLQRDVVYPLALGHMVHDIFSSFLSPFLPLLIAKFSLSMTLAGALSMVFRLTAVGNPLLGVLTDRLDLRPWLALSPVVTAACMCLLGRASSFAMACALVLVAGASASVIHVVAPVYVARYSGARVGFGMSVWMAGGELARTLGPLAAVALVAVAGFEGVAPAMAVGVAASLYLWAVLRRLPVPPRAAFRMPVWSVMVRLRRLMLPMAGVLLARALVALVVMRYLPTYLVASGKSLWVGGGGLALLELSGVISAFVAGNWSDRVGRRRILAGSMLGASVFMLLFVHADGWLLAPALVGLGIFSMASMPVTLAIIQDCSPESRGAANGLFMGLSALMGSSTLFFVGWLVDVMGFRGAFTACALASFAGVPLVALLPRREKARHVAF